MKVHKEKLLETFTDIKEFCLKHIFITVLSTLFTLILIFSYFVYQAKQSNTSAFQSYADALWWALVTVLTVGYGEIVPITSNGRIYASLLMISGVLSMGVLTARISSFFLERALNERRGKVNPDQLHDHFIICGWKLKCTAS